MRDQKTRLALSKSRRKQLPTISVTVGQRILTKTRNGRFLSVHRIKDSSKQLNDFRYLPGYSKRFSNHFDQSQYMLAENSKVQFQ